MDITANINLVPYHLTEETLFCIVEKKLHWKDEDYPLPNGERAIVDMSEEAASFHAEPVFNLLKEYGYSEVVIFAV